MIARLPAAIVLVLGCLIVSCMVFLKELRAPYYGGYASSVALASDIVLLGLSVTAIGRAVVRLHRATEAQARLHLGTVMLGTIGFLAAAVAAVFLAMNFFI